MTILLCFITAIKAGITERKIISDVIIKGDVFAPMFCSKHVDTFGQEWLGQNIQGPGSHTSLKYD